MTGKKFGSLKVIKQDRPNGENAGWICKCKCGKIIHTRSLYLRNGWRKCCDECWKHPKNKSYKEIGWWYYRNVAKGAERRRIEFKVSLKYIWELYLKQDRKCALTDEKINFHTEKVWYKNRSNQTASLDRIDSKQGYVKGNVQWVHKDINIMKWNFTEDHFIKLCSMVHRKFNG